MNGYKARVYYDLEGMPHTWVRLSTPDGENEETRGFAPAIYSPVWKGRVKDDTGHGWTLYRQYDISEEQYREMKGVIDNWRQNEPTYVLGQRDCRYLVHDVMAKRGGYDGAGEHAFNGQSRIAFTVEGCLSIFKELGRDQGLVNDISERIRSQRGGHDLIDEAGVQEAVDSSYWPGGEDDDSSYSPPGMAP